MGLPRMPCCAAKAQSEKSNVVGIVEAEHHGHVRNHRCCFGVARGVLKVMLIMMVLMVTVVIISTNRLQKGSSGHL